VHHVRSFGSPKSDRRAIPLEFGLHQVQEGPHSIEAMGKVRWQVFHAVDIEKEIARLQKAYLERYPDVKW
jgi:hypothetical protein